MGVTIRKVKWITTYLRPVAMPATRCPIVKDWDTGEVKTAVMGITHCLPCAHAKEIHLDMDQQAGEVHCDG